MKSMTRLLLGTAIAAALTLGVSRASAQGKAPARPVRATPMSHPMTPSKPANATPSTAAPKSNPSDSFKGVATKLGTTPEAMQTAYDAARQSNPKLTRGQFVAANMVAHNLGAKHPAITTQAILGGLQSGKSMGQTLQGLGLSEQDAREAEHQANRDLAAAQKVTM